MTNGYGDRWNDRFRSVEAQTEEMKVSLTLAINGLSASVNLLAMEVRELTKNFKNAVPIRLVLVMFLIVIGALFGIESVKLLPKFFGV